MPSLVKTLGLFTVLLLLQPSAYSQLRIKKSSGDIATDLRKVIQDHSNQFQNIIGEAIVENPQSTGYRCNLEIEGAEECTITRYTSDEEPIYSWQALMLTTENFNVAKRKFKLLFDQFNNMAIVSSYLKGTYEAPVEEKKFTSVLFSISPADESSRKLRVEILLESEMMEWKVRVLVYDREREDDEKGGIVE